MISDDPNAPELLALRAEMTNEAFSGFVPDRVAHLVSLSEGKRVLDVGVIDHNPKNKSRKGDAWLHGAIAAAAADCIGIDILGDEVETLRQQGYNVRVADATTAEFDRPFDVIVAGEIIEHLGNPGDLLDMAKRNLAADGVLAVTTPNTFFVGRVWKNWRALPTDSVDHVVLLWPSGIIELAERAGLRLHAWHPVTLSKPLNPLKSMVFVILNWLWTGLRMSPLSRAETIIYELRHADDASRQDPQTPESDRR